jgi:membrane associated rhomboid family serine protease
MSDFPENDSIPFGKRLFYAFFIPVLFVLLMWLVKGFEWVFDTSFYSWGVFPRRQEGLAGIFLYPFLHQDIKHLFGNSIPMLFLGGSLFFFYRSIALQVFFWLYLASGIWLWTAGRPSWHIGASGMVYALSFFLFLSGVWRQHPRLMALSLIVVFLYGSLIWGLFPIEPHMSYEGHLTGALAGGVVAWFYRRRGPQYKKFEWPETEEDDEMEDEQAVPVENLQSDSEKANPENPLKIVYSYKEKEKENKEDPGKNAVD